MLGSATETNFWAERRRNTDTPRQQPQQLAALPLNNSAFNSQTLLNQLPSVSTTFPKATNRTANLSPQFQSLIDSIPLLYGSIQDVYDAGDKKSAPVILIQDVHLNTEAQTNIAALLQELINQKQIVLVGVEGAFNAFDFAPFRKLSDKTKAADFLNKNLMAAPSYVGITSPVEPPPFVGVDDQMHYNANLEALFTAREQKPRVQEQVRAMEQDIDNVKKSVFSPELNEIDGLRTAYRKGTIGFGTYVQKLATRASENDLNIEQFLAAYEMESNLDFKRVEAERKTVIEKLTKELNEKEVSNLVAQSLAYRMGRIGFGAYYLGLKKLCEQKGIRLAQTPNFDNYIRYVLLSDGIKAENLFDAVDRLEQAVIASLAKTEEEKTLVARSDQISLIDKLLEFSLTPKEWERYKSVIPAQTGIQVSNNSLNKVYSLDSRLRGDDGSLKPFESFYEEADARSKKMLENLSAQNAAGVKAFVLGGFHTPQVAQLLREQKIPYVIVSPKLTRVDDASGSAYLSVFAREKTPLEKLFSGQKLFISPARLAIGSDAVFQPVAGVKDLDVEMKQAGVTEEKYLGGKFFRFGAPLSQLEQWLSSLWSQLSRTSRADFDSSSIPTAQDLIVLNEIKREGDTVIWKARDRRTNRIWFIKATNAEKIRSENLGYLYARLAGAYIPLVAELQVSDLSISNKENMPSTSPVALLTQDVNDVAVHAGDAGFEALLALLAFTDQRDITMVDNLHIRQDPQLAYVPFDLERAGFTGHTASRHDPALDAMLIVNGLWHANIQIEKLLHAIDVFKNLDEAHIRALIRKSGLNDDTVDMPAIKSRQAALRERLATGLPEAVQRAFAFAQQENSGPTTADWQQRLKEQLESVDGFKYPGVDGDVAKLKAELDAAGGNIMSTPTFKQAQQIADALSQSSFDSKNTDKGSSFPSPRKKTELSPNTSKVLAVAIMLALNYFYGPLFDSIVTGVLLAALIGAALPFVHERSMLAKSKAAASVFTLMVTLLIATILIPFGLSFAIRVLGYSEHMLPQAFVVTTILGVLLQGLLIALSNRFLTSKFSGRTPTTRAWRTSGLISAMILSLGLAFEPSHTGVPVTAKGTTVYVVGTTDPAFLKYVKASLEFYPLKLPARGIIQVHGGKTFEGATYRLKDFIGGFFGDVFYIAVTSNIEQPSMETLLSHELTHQTVNLHSPNVREFARSWLLNNVELKKDARTNDNEDLTALTQQFYSNTVMMLEQNDGLQRVTPAMVMLVIKEHAIRENGRTFIPLYSNNKFLGMHEIQLDAAPEVLFKKIREQVKTLESGATPSQLTDGQTKVQLFMERHKKMLDATSMISPLAPDLDKRLSVLEEVMSSMQLQYPLQLFIDPRGRMTFNMIQVFPHQNTSIPSAEKISTVLKLDSSYGLHGEFTLEKISKLRSALLDKVQESSAKASIIESLRELDNAATQIDVWRGQAHQPNATETKDMRALLKRANDLLKLSKSAPRLNSSFVPLLLMTALAYPVLIVIILGVASAVVAVRLIVHGVVNWGGSTSENKPPQDKSFFVTLFHNKVYLLYQALHTNTAYNRDAETDYDLYPKTRAAQEESSGLTVRDAAYAANSAGFFALESALWMILKHRHRPNQQDQTVAQVLQDIRTGGNKLDDYERELLMRVAHLAWSAGKPFRVKK